ncbi:non-hemolytic enterotoxin lytic component L2 [Bacillus cereus HuB4-4]|uniref:Non-hemolytic enterotoxin lytic component L2 n=1 Tax=Bacillus cereus HuB4-4 TaxID=1053211 RepID=A0A9W5QWQ2_BACCE|nr:HBL/NHE enterotoxin family protein [Bacillus cereus]EOP91864.1 non-hemolytic enterotoxin lytic component L2 [Bacillus cereus HuB4-4]
MKKNLIAGLLVTAVSTISLTSVNAYAEEVKFGLKPTYKQNEMVPNTISNSIRMLGAQSPLAQAYGLVILQQPDIKVNAMSSLTNHQKFAKKNVEEWIDEYNPKLINLNQQMMRYSKKFNSYYSRLYELAGKVNEDAQAKEDFKNAYGKLLDQVQTIQENMDQSSLELNRFKTGLDKDSQNLSQKADAAIQSLQGSNGDINQLRAEIKRIHEEIQAELSIILNRPNQIIKGSINIGKEVFTITNQAAQMKTIDFVSISALSEEFINASDSQTRQAALRIQQKQKELIPLIQKLSETEIQATGIIFIEDQVNSFTELIGRQVSTLDYLLNDWKVLNSNMNQIKLNLETEKYADKNSLQKDLDKFKKINDEINKQTNQYEEYITNIEVH